MRTTIIPFTAGDGFQCNLLHVEGDRPATRGPVLLVHGAGVRANIFRAPVKTNFVDYLVDAGYDVWLENWRASIDFRPNEWTLDKAALYDHPKAVQAVIAETGAKSVQAVIHCQGSTSFMMSAVAGLLPEVSTIVTNAVSLHTVVPPLSKFKIASTTGVISIIARYLDAQWGVQAPGIFPKLLKAYVNATHRECDNTVCKFSSFIYGTGHPTLWKHENLDEATHHWLTHEFAQCPVSFFRQMKDCISAGHLVGQDGFLELPDDFTALPPATDARIAFFTGDQNECFLPESQVRSFNYFNAYRPQFHSLNVIPGYGHLDIFMGQHAVRDVFPQMIAQLD